MKIKDNWSSTGPCLLPIFTVELTNQTHAPYLNCRPKVCASHLKCQVRSSSSSLELFFSAKNISGLAERLQSLHDSGASGSIAASSDCRDRFNLRAIKPKNSCLLLPLYCGYTALFKVNLLTHYTASAAMVTFAFLRTLPSADVHRKWLRFLLLNWSYLWVCEYKMWSWIVWDCKMHVVCQFTLDIWLCSKLFGCITGK